MRKIQINGTLITLTQEQINDINRQQFGINHYTQIKSIKDACKVMNILIIPESPIDIILTFCKAFNRLSYKLDKFPDFDNKDQNKWFPIFNKTLGGLVFYGSASRCGCGFDGQVGFCRTEEESDYLGKICLKEYEKLITIY